MANLFSTAPRGLWADAARRFARDTSAVISLVIVIGFVLVAILAARLAPQDPMRLSLSTAYMPPAWVKVGPNGLAGSPQYLLGTDYGGRDVLSRLIFGARSSMFVGLAAGAITALIGTLIGLFAGYMGSRAGNLLMRVTDVFYAFPTIMFYIIIVLILRDTPVGDWISGMFMIVMALAAVGWVGLARLVHGTVLSIKQAEFVEAARSVGVAWPRIVFRHVLPNCVSLVAVWIALTIPRMILVESMLGYLGIGLGPAAERGAFFLTSWGGLFLEGRTAIHVQPWVLLAPALCVGLVGMSFTLLADGLRDALDPRLRRG